MRPPQQVGDPLALRARCDRARAEGRSIGLVPTMGALHEGHLSLVDVARSHGADLVVVTIFVNPTQFGPGEDFDRYPRTLDDDLARCREAGVDWVFAPSTEAMYPEGAQTSVEVGELTSTLEGAHRPGHLRGVTTIVAKLFAATGPCVAVFGRKDYQQWKTIERMARDLFMPVRVVGAPIIREPDGLALSSRNRYLNEAERARALAIIEGLRAAERAFADGEREVAKLEGLVREPITRAADSVDYVALVDPDDLAPLEGRPLRALVTVAARFGSTRLIDNLLLDAAKTRR